MNRKTKANLAIALGILAPIISSQSTGGMNKRKVLDKIREGKYWGSGQLSAVFSDVDDDKSLLMLSIDPTKELLVEAHKKYPKDKHIPRFEKLGTVDKVRWESDYTDLPSPIPYNVYKIEKLKYELEEMYDHENEKWVNTPEDDAFMQAMNDLMLSFPRQVIKTSIPNSWPNVPKSVLTSLKRLVEIAKSKKKYHDFTWDLSMMGGGSAGVNIRKNLDGPYKLIDLMMPKLGVNKPLSLEEIEMYHWSGPFEYTPRKQRKMSEDELKIVDMHRKRLGLPSLAELEERMKPVYAKQDETKKKRYAYLNKLFEDAGVQSLRLGDKK